MLVLIEHRGKSPHVDQSAYVAPTAVLCGDVRIGPDCRVLFGAVITAEDGSVELGARCVVTENALIRGRATHAAVLGDDVLVGPQAHLNGTEVGDGAFLATGCALFPGSRIGRGAEIRIHGVVQVNSVIEDEGLVPIGWVAVGDPAQTFAPDHHNEIWEIQSALDFPGTLYGIAREASARERMTRQAEWFGEHRGDTAID